MQSKLRIEMQSEMADTFITLLLEVVTDSSFNSRKRHSSPNTSTNSVVEQWSMNYSTYSKWNGELDKERQTLSWLDYELISKGTKESCGEI